MEINKSIEQISDRKLLESVLFNQIIIYRSIDRMEKFFERIGNKYPEIYNDGNENENFEKNNNYQDEPLNIRAKQELNWDYAATFKELINNSTKAKNDIENLLNKNEIDVNWP